MFKFLAAAFLLSLAFTACPEPLERWGMLRPIDNFALAFAVENRMDVPVTVNIRSRYIVGEGNGFFVTYGEWIGESLGSLETGSLGNDARGNFMLMNPTLKHMAMRNRLVSSFEIRVETPSGAMHFAGYETEDPRFEAVGLCYMESLSYAENEGSTLRTKEQRVLFKVDYILPTHLIINEDGTVSFLAERVTNGDGRRVHERFDTDVATVRRMY